MPTALRGKAGEKVISPIDVVQMQQFFLPLVDQMQGLGPALCAFLLPWALVFPKHQWPVLEYLPLPFTQVTAAAVSGTKQAMA